VGLARSPYPKPAADVQFGMWVNRLAKCISAAHRYFKSVRLLSCRPGAIVRVMIASDLVARHLSVAS
jgi:hypothetical protein